jgi:hypothetical protein
VFDWLLPDPVEDFDVDEVPPAPSSSSTKTTLPPQAATRPTKVENARTGCALMGQLQKPGVASPHSTGQDWHTTQNKTPCR